MNAATVQHPAGLMPEANLAKIRSRFPVLTQEVNGHPLTYLDNAATTHKPESVISALQYYYTHDNANIHRGIHTLAERATRDFESTRKALATFFNIPSTDEVIFTRGVTEGINLVASGFAKSFLKPGDAIILSGLEHHSNIVPWQMAAEVSGAVIRVIPVLDDGTLDMDAYHTLLKKGPTRIVAVNHASNSLGTINPIHTIIRGAKEAGAAVLIDGAQAAAHLPVDMQELDCDFYVVSAHKMYGPTGVGMLYGKREWLEALPPWQGGGEMIREVTFEKTTYNSLPYKFEAGTPNIADVVAWKKAIEFILSISKPVMEQHEQALLKYVTAHVEALPGVRIYGSASEKVSVLSFTLDGMHPFDVGQLLDARGIAVRTGHHCTQPLMQRFGIEGTIRASFAVYNSIEDASRFLEALGRIITRKTGKS